MHPKDNEIYPLETVVRIKRTNEFAVIKRHTFQKDGKGFLHYLGEIESREGLYCLIHDEIEVEALPPENN